MKLRLPFFVSTILFNPTFDGGNSGARRITTTTNNTNTNNDSCSTTTANITIPSISSILTNLQKLTTTTNVPNSVLSNTLRFIDGNKLLFQLRQRTEPLRLEYSIFRGRSALRELNPHEKQLLLSIPDCWSSPTPSPATNTTGRADTARRKDDGSLLSTTTGETSTATVDNNDEKAPQAAYRVIAILFLLLLLLQDDGNTTNANANANTADAVHELLLGVTPHNIPQAEYAASHPGQTSWSADHPSTTVADFLHGILHRYEGCLLGEGNHTGYDNAKYWFGGGPKRSDAPAWHPVRDELAEVARRFAPQCVECGDIISSGVRHEIIAGGGGGQEKDQTTTTTTTRTIHVPKGQWDDIAFCDLCRQKYEGGLKDNSELIDEIALLQLVELVLLLRHELREARAVSFVR